MPSELYINAPNKFCLMFLVVSLEICIASTTEYIDPCIKAISALSIATSVPVPIANPMSAAASAGASFIPSPTMPTILPSA